MYSAHNRDAICVAVAGARIAAPADRPADAGVAEHRRRNRAVVQHAERSGHVELGVSVVVEPGVDLIPVECERRLCEIVVPIPVQIVCGKVAPDLARDRIHPCCGNDVQAARVRRRVAQRVIRIAGKHLKLGSSGPVRIPRKRVVNRGGRERQVSLQHRRQRHRNRSAHRPVISNRLVADEVEGLVLPDRPSDGPAELVVALVWFGSCIQRRVVEPHRPRFQMLVREIFESRSVHRVRSAASLDVDRRTAGEPLLRVEAASDDVDFLNGLEGRDV